MPAKDNLTLIYEKVQQKVFELPKTFELSSYQTKLLQTTRNTSKICPKLFSKKKLVEKEY